MVFEKVRSVVAKILKIDEENNKLSTEIKIYADKNKEIRFWRISLLHNGCSYCNGVYYYVYIKAYSRWF